MNNKDFIIKVNEHELALKKYIDNKETDKYFESHKLEIIGDKLEYFAIENKNIGSGVIVKSQLKTGKFSNCEAIGMYLTDNIFKGIDFKKVILRKSEFNGSHFIETSFKDCDITKCIFVGCKFLNTTFQNCNLSWSNFINADLKEVNFNNVSLEGSVIVDSKVINKAKQTIDFGKEYPAHITNVSINIQGKSKIVGLEGLREYLDLTF